jgi:hypothetical protein
MLKDYSVFVCDSSSDAIEKCAQDLRPDSFEGLPELVLRSATRITDRGLF